MSNPLSVPRQSPSNTLGADAWELDERVNAGPDAPATTVDAVRLPLEIATIQVPADAIAPEAMIFASVHVAAAVLASPVTMDLTISGGGVGAPAVRAAALVTILQMGCITLGLLLNAADLLSTPQTDVLVNLGITTDANLADVVALSAFIDIAYREVPTVRLVT